MGDRRRFEVPERGDDVVRELLKLRGRVYAILIKAEKEGDLKTALAGCREARGCIELLARLTGYEPPPPERLSVRVEKDAVR